MCEKVVVAGNVFIIWAVHVNREKGEPYPFIHPILSPALSSKYVRDFIFLINLKLVVTDDAALPLDHDA